MGPGSLSLALSLLCTQDALLSEESQFISIGIAIKEQYFNSILIIEQFSKLDKFRLLAYDDSTIRTLKRP
jgi:hypothetical protein